MRDTPTGDASFEASEAQLQEILKQRLLQDSESLVVENDLIGKGIEGSISGRVSRIPENRFEFGKIAERTGQQPDANRGDAGGTGRDQGQVPGPGLPFPMAGAGQQGKGDPGQGSGDGSEPGPGAGEGAGELTFETNVSIEEILAHELPEINLRLEDLGLGRIRTRKTATIRGRMREGPRVLEDIRATVIERVKRKVSRGKGSVERVRFVNPDFRYHRPEIHEDPDTRADVFLILDTSGSMNEGLRRYIARIMGLVIVTKIRARYEEVNLHFIIQDSQALEVEEHKWFSKAPSGGTRISEGFSNAFQIWRETGGKKVSNAYCFAFSDCDNIVNDNPVVLSVVGEMLKEFNLIAIYRTDSQKADIRNLFGNSKVAADNLVYREIDKKADIGPALVATFATERARKQKGRRR